MRNWILAAGAAALALTVPAIAQPDKNKGGGNQGRGQQSKADRGGGNQGRGGPAMRPDKQGGPDRGAAMRPDRGRDDSPRQARSDDRGKGKDVRSVEVKDNRGRGDGRDGDIRIVRRDFDGGGAFRVGRSGFDCPPGLDRKDNGCLPPGQAMKLLGAPLLATFADDRVPYQYRSWFPDNDDYYFRAGDGFIYRVDRSDNLVDGLIPLFGSGYYAVGDPWPQPYDFYNVPYQYRSYWPQGGDAYYRYGDGAIYRVNPQTNLVSAIVALLAGDLGVGSRLPVGYDTYNVPLAYRAQYYDTPDAWYRYNDGYIYRVDPTTRLITAVIDAIV